MEFHDPSYEIGNIITYTGFDGTERRGEVVEATANIKGGHPGFVVETPGGRCWGYDHQIRQVNTAW